MQEQYIFIHDAILEAVTCGDTQINASDLRKSIHQLRHRDPTINLTGYESQFKAHTIASVTMHECTTYIHRSRYFILYRHACTLFRHCVIFKINSLTFYCTDTGKGISQSERDTAKKGSRESHKESY